MTDDPYRCICPLDPADLANGYPRAVEGCPAHRARYAAQQHAGAAPVLDAVTPADTAAIRAIADGPSRAGVTAELEEDA